MLQRNQGTHQKEQPQIFLLSLETFWLVQERVLVAILRASQARMHFDICPAFSYNSNVWLLHK